MNAPGPRPATWTVEVADGDLEHLAGLLAAHQVRTARASSPETRARRAAGQRLHDQITTAIEQTGRRP